MTRVYKSKKNLERIWKQLDNASGELYNAREAIASMSDMPKEVTSSADRIDVTEIDSLKSEIELLIDAKKN
jgi:hypothetical protein